MRAITLLLITTFKTRDMKKLIIFLVLTFPLILQAQIRVEQIRSTGTPSGHVATADGSGGVSWQPQSGGVTSVNSQTGVVVLDADDIDDASTVNKFITANDLSKLAGIASGAEVNVNADWNAVSGDAQILNKPTIPSAASQISFTPNGSISATNVQAAVQEVRDEAASSTAPPQTITYSATPTQDFTSGATGVITLTGNVTTYTLSNIPDNGTGGIIIIQDGTGGYGIADIVHTGLGVNYINGVAPTAANINSVANGHTVLNYWRVGNYLYVTFGNFGASL